ncbi:hypothetical protein BEWA_004910 [Theileria equi strain WA]|uniref:Uncharacterized protein n=1 Tax=Theileria equi strain WA TaxID=1537102 RepID=L0B0P4_THEEQ|nr:hypothetical protein BEWA_004910 [Theileria equi strain WA]AFZ81083.1 hypothetical protein BEWA_004910 [Theileria equi strain WA]|eukprot:XP_004830749.1 hypothetical protein BEWA_004910 [Theileria equi strain WA]
MKYLLGGSTGLLKEIDTTNRTLQCFTRLQDQSLDKNVTSMCWSGGFGGYLQDKITVGHSDGTLRLFEFPTMEILKEVKLPSKCIHVSMLGKHFDQFGPDFYAKNDNSILYPAYSDSDVYNGHDRQLLAVCESGHIFVFDWSLDSDSSVSKVLDLVTGESTDTDIPGIISGFKYKSPINAVAVNSLMTNRIVIGGLEIPPILFDLFTGKILWAGKYPHATLLDLKSAMDIRGIVFLEDIDQDTFCVSTSDSSIYVYDTTSQRDPIFELNICDERAKGLSYNSLLYSGISDHNTKHRKLLNTSINVNYSHDNRNIIRMTTTPNITVEHVKGEEDSTNTLEGHGLSIKCRTLGGNDYCNIYISDNVGSVYHMQLLTGDRLVEWVHRKLCKSKEYKKDVKKLSYDEKLEVMNHLIEARKRLASSSHNDKHIHFRKSGYNQFIGKVIYSFNIHNGAVLGLQSIGNYLVTASLDRFTKVLDIKTGKVIYQHYCNQKQTSILVPREYFLETFDNEKEFKALKEPEPEPEQDPVVPSEDGLDEHMMDELEDNDPFDDDD